MLRKLTLISRICGEQKNGGERGIRTLGELPHTTFPMWRLRPLDHLSAMFRFNNIAPIFCFSRAFFEIKSIFLLFFLAEKGSGSNSEIFFEGFGKLITVGKTTAMRRF